MQHPTIFSYSLDSAPDCTCIRNFNEIGCPSVRKQHNAGYKHKANVRAYYQQFEEQQTQSLIDQKVKEHLGQQAAFQHFAAFQSGPYKPPLVPVLPRPLPIPGASPASTAAPFMPPIRPPVLPPPGFNAAQTPPSFRPPVGSAPASTFSSIQGNGVIRPPTLPLPGPPVIQPAGLSSSNTANGAPVAVPATLNSYPQSLPVATSGPYGSFNSTLQPTALAGAFSQPQTSDSNVLNSNFPSQTANSSMAQGSFMFAQTSAGQHAMGQTTSSSFASPPGAPVGYQS